MAYLFTLRCISAFVSSYANNSLVQIFSFSIPVIRLPITGYSKKPLCLFKARSGINFDNVSYKLTQYELSNYVIRLPITGYSKKL